ncbi:MAG: tetratricopeptide repeat protein [Cyanobacteriota bacterium]|nr:tetratricopeptide repeat protein [Cyanobacteriota bacterium]
MRFAIADFNRALQLEPNNNLAYLYRGRAYVGKRDKQNAVKDFKKALELTEDTEFKQVIKEALQIIENSRCTYT